MIYGLILSTSYEDPVLHEQARDFLRSLVTTEYRMTVRDPKRSIRIRWKSEMPQEVPLDAAGGTFFAKTRLTEPSILQLVYSMVHVIARETEQHFRMNRGDLKVNSTLIKFIDSHGYPGPPRMTV